MLPPILNVSRAKPAMAGIAFVTPSYPYDLQRCGLLVESLDRCCPQARHYIIVDRYDAKQFAHLSTERTVIVESESVIDREMRRLPGHGGIWVGVRTLATRGWIMQQIRKISASRFIDDETLVFCDSDMAFIRPFDRSNLMVDGKIGLLDIAYENDEVRHWTKLARELLGLPLGGEVRGHVGQLICWRRDVMVAMQARIEEVQGVPWQRALARLRTFSEYILYGVFVRECLGYENAEHRPSQVPLVKTSWDTSITTPAGMRSFFDTIEDPNIAIMAHSHDRIDWEAYRASVQAQWQKAGVF